MPASQEISASPDVKINIGFLPETLFHWYKLISVFEDLHIASKYDGLIYLSDSAYTASKPKAFKSIWRAMESLMEDSMGGDTGLPRADQVRCAVYRGEAADDLFFIRDFDE